MLKLIQQLRFEKPRNNVTVQINENENLIDILKLYDSLLVASDVTTVQRYPLEDNPILTLRRVPKKRNHAAYQNK